MFALCSCEYARYITKTIIESAKARSVLRSTKMMPLRDRVVAAGVEGMATKNPTQPEPRTANHAVASDRLFGKRRAGRCEATARSDQRTDGTPVQEKEQPHQEMGTTRLACRLIATCRVHIRPLAFGLHQGSRQRCSDRHITRGGQGEQVPDATRGRVDPSDAHRAGRATALRPNAGRSPRGRCSRATPIFVGETTHGVCASSDYARRHSRPCGWQ